MKDERRFFVRWRYGETLEEELCETLELAQARAAAIKEAAKATNVKLLYGPMVEIEEDFL